MFKWLCFIYFLFLHLLVGICAQSNIDVYREAGIRFLESKKYVEALDYFDRAFVERPGDMETIFYLGKAYFLINDHDRAIRFLEVIPTANPLSQEATSIMASIRNEKERYRLLQQRIDIRSSIIKKMYLNFGWTNLNFEEKKKAALTNLMVSDLEKSGVLSATRNKNYNIKLLQKMVRSSGLMALGGTTVMLLPVISYDVHISTVSKALLRHLTDFLPYGSTSMILTWFNRKNDILEMVYFQEKDESIPQEKLWILNDKEINPLALADPDKVSIKEFRQRVYQ